MPPFDFPSILQRSKQKYTTRNKEKDVPGSPDSFFSPPLPPVPPPIQTLPPPSVAFPYSNTRFPWPLGHQKEKPDQKQSKSNNNNPPPTTPATTNLTLNSNVNSNITSTNVPTPILGLAFGGGTNLSVQGQNQGQSQGQGQGTLAISPPLPLAQTSAASGPSSRANSAKSGPAVPLTGSASGSGSGSTPAVTTGGGGGGGSSSGPGLQLDVDLSFTDSLFDGLSIFEKRRSGIGSTKSGLGPKGTSVTNLNNVTPPTATTPNTANTTYTNTSGGGGPSSNNGSPSLRPTRMAPTPPAPLQIPSKPPTPSRLNTNTNTNAAPPLANKSTSDLSSQPPPQPPHPTQQQPSQPNLNFNTSGPSSPTPSYTSYTSYSGSSASGSVYSYTSAPDLDIDYFGLSSAVIPSSSAGGGGGGSGVGGSRTNLSPESATRTGGGGNGGGKGNNYQSKSGGGGGGLGGRNTTWSRRSHRLTRQDSAVLPHDPWWFAMQGQEGDALDHGGGGMVLGNNNGRRSRKVSTRSRRSRRNSIASTYEVAGGATAHLSSSSNLAALNLSTPNASLFMPEGSTTAASSFYGGVSGAPSAFGLMAHLHHPPSSFAASASRRNSLRHASQGSAAGGGGGSARRRQSRSRKGIHVGPGQSRPGSAASSAPPSAFPSGVGINAGADKERASSTWSIVSAGSGGGSGTQSGPSSGQWAGWQAQAQAWSAVPGSGGFGRFPSPVEPMPEGAAQIAAEASRAARKGIQQVLLSGCGGCGGGEEAEEEAAENGKGRGELEQEERVSPMGESVPSLSPSNVKSGPMPSPPPPPPPAQAQAGPSLPRSYSSPNAQKQATQGTLSPRPPPSNLPRSYTAPDGLVQVRDDKMTTAAAEAKVPRLEHDDADEDQDQEEHGDNGEVTLDSVLEGYNTPIAIKHQQQQKVPPPRGASIMNRSRSASAAPPFRSEVQGGGVVERKGGVGGERDRDRIVPKRKLTEPIPALVTAGYVSGDGEAEAEGEEDRLGGLRERGGGVSSSSSPPGRRTSRIMSLSPAQRASLHLHPDLHLLHQGQTHGRTNTMGSFISASETEVSSMYPNPSLSRGTTPPPPPPLPAGHNRGAEGEYVMVGRQDGESPAARDKKSQVDDEEEDMYLPAPGHYTENGMHRHPQSIMLTPPFGSRSSLPPQQMPDSAGSLHSSGGSPRQLANTNKGSPMMGRASTPDSARSLEGRSPRPLPSPLNVSRPQSRQESSISSPPPLLPDSANDGAGHHAAEVAVHEGEDHTTTLARKESGVSMRNRTESRNGSSTSLSKPSLHRQSQSQSVQTPTSSISNYSNVSSANSPIVGPISMAAAAVATATAATAASATGGSSGGPSASTLSLNSSTQSLSQPSSIPGSTRRRISNHQFTPDGISPAPNPPSHRLSSAVGINRLSSARMLPIGKQQTSITQPTSFERVKVASETTPPSRPTNNKKDGTGAPPHRPAPLPLRHGRVPTESLDFPETPAMFSPIPTPEARSGATRGVGGRRDDDGDGLQRISSMISPTTLVPVPPRNMMPLPPVIENVPPAKKRVMGPRERPPGPAGPRKLGSSSRVPQLLQQQQTGGSTPSTTGRTTPASGPTPTLPPAPAQITPPAPPPAQAASASPSPPAQSVSASTSPGPTTLSPTSPKFQSRQVDWRGLTMEAAKWTFTSSQLQEIVGRAIRQTAESSSIRLLTVEQLDVEIPREIQRLEGVQQDIIQRYRTAVRRRRILFGTLATENDPRARQELYDLCVLCDQLTEEMFHVMDELMQLHKLRDVHSASALGMALRKLNSSFLKQTEAAAEMSKNVTQLEAEKDEAWATAERVERELMEVQAKYEALLASTGGTSSSGITTNGTGTPASSARSSRVSAARKTSVRASKASLRLSRGTRLSIGSNNPLSALASAMPPVPPIPRARGFGSSPRSLSVNTDLPTASEYSTGSNSPSRALAEAQKELYDMLGFTPADSRTGSRYLSMVSSSTGSGLYRRASEVVSPTSLPGSPFAPSSSNSGTRPTSEVGGPPLRRNASFVLPPRTVEANRF